MSALLLKKGVDTSTHKGIRQMFGLHFVQTGLISKEYARFFSDLYDRRQTGDYDDFVMFDEETSNKLFSVAKEFVQEIDSLIKVAKIWSIDLGSSLLPKALPRGIATFVPETHL